MNVFGRSKPIRAMHLTTTPPKLPTNFAEKLLELETQLAYNLSTSLISSLMELYSSAIEYYESIQDKKYLHYKDRLHSLLSRKDVLDALSCSTPKTQPQKSGPVRARHFQSTNMEETKNRPLTGSISSVPLEKKEVDVAIDEHLHETTTASSIVKASIRRQEGDNLQERLQARKRASSARPQKKVEKVVDKGNKLELYQKEIEDIMEKYAEDKVNRIQTIEKKYAGEKTEEKEKMMKKEIEEAQLEIIRERKEKIATLRAKFET